MYNNTRDFMTKFFIVYAGSVVSMLGIFLTTMLVHYQRLDPEYLEYALIRILILSALSGVLCIGLHKRGCLFLFVSGVITGPLVGAVYVCMVR